jgi:hypothetical protein
LIRIACESQLVEPVPTAGLRARIEDGLLAPPPAGRTGMNVLFSRWGIAAAAVLAVGILGTLVGRPEPVVPGETARRPNPTSTPSVPGTVNPPEPDLTREAVEDTPPREAVGVTARSMRGDARGAARRTTWLESQTSRHLERAQLLLRSVRNAQAVSALELHYERSLSRELVIRNRLLRRRAERQADASAAEVLVQVEPLLLDIANLPDHAAADDIAALQSLIRTQGIIAELRLYTSMHGA